MYHHPALENNPCLRLIAVEHGGHLGFLARRRPRFWLDALIVRWWGGWRQSFEQEKGPTLERAGPFVKRTTS
jgi:predicted alpha/beta-fold hydrolase